MKIPIPENLRGVDILRQASYGQVRDRNNPEESYARRLGGGIYPRFHAYINPGFINLHLDQKQASYQGQSKHSGEYDGEVVEEEGARIKTVAANMANPADKEDEQDEDHRHGQGSAKGGGKGFFSGLFR